MAMVVGNEEYDWKALELGCEYKNGYAVSDDTVFIHLLLFTFTTNKIIKFQQNIYFTCIPLG